MAESLIRDTLRAELISVFDDPNFSPPPLPSVALELMSLSGRKNVSAEDVARLLEQDVMLAGSVMRLVGSPLYAGRSPIRTLKDAVVRLGFKLVRDVVFEAALSRGVFDLPEYGETIEQLRRHSTVVAYISREVCARVRIDGDHAFICGLLHDIGFAGLLFAVTQIEQTSSPPLGAIWSEVDALHEQATGILSRLWNFPDQFLEVVSYHHHLHTGRFSRVAGAVCIADYLSAEFGADVVGPLDAEGKLLPADRVSEVDLEVARAELGINDALFAAISAEAEKMVPQILWL